MCHLFSRQIFVLSVSSMVIGLFMLPTYFFSFLKIVLKYTLHKIYHFNNFLVYNFIALSISKFTVSYNHYHSISETFLLPQTETLYALNNNTHCLLFPASGNLCSIFYLRICLFWEPHIRGIIHYLSFCVWLISFSTFSGSSVLYHLSEFHSFLRLDILLYI